MKKLFFALITLFFYTTAFSVEVPVLVYHTLNPTIPGSMTITPSRVEAQLNWLKQHGYTVIPMRELVSYLQGKTNTLPPKSVVITDDDGHKSVYTYLLPIAEKYHIPVTLFIYPQIISHAKYALTWEQLKALQKTGLFDVEGHTYWHPNFKQDRKRMSPAAFQKMVDVQLIKSKQVIEKKLGTPITLLAWPFGIHDAYLENQAAKAGYVEAFSIAYRSADRAEKPMAMPRYMMIESQSMKTFAAIVEGRAQGKRKIKHT